MNGTTTQERRKGAELIFIQGDDRYDPEQRAMLRSWRGKLVGRCLDRQDARNGRESWATQVRYTARIVEVAPDTFKVTTCGAELGGTRHSTFYPTSDYDRYVGIERDPLAEAQAYLAKWARTRFYLAPASWLEQATIARKETW